MKISFYSISKDSANICLKKHDISFDANAIKINEKLVKCTSHIYGTLPYICDRCGEEFSLHVDEKVETFASNGVAKDSTCENIIEFYDECIDFDMIFTSELECIKSDYFYCEKCKNLKGE